MRIRTRIHLTLGTVLVLHIFTAVMGHIGLDKSQRDLQAIESTNADTIRVLAIDKGIAELQRNVSTYMLSGHVSAATRVREILASVQADIELASQLTEEQFVTDDLLEMAQRIDSFGVNFEKVITDRENKVSLIHDKMLPTKLSLFEHLNDNYELTHPHVRAIRDYIYSAENAALRYFETPNRSKVDQALQSLELAKSLTNDPLDQDPRTTVIQGLIDEYEFAFLEAIQATQGYMHLVHVVLAGEAAELLYQSSQIKTASLNKRLIIKETMVAGARQFQIVSDSVAALTVLAGVFTAWLMTKSVLLPILSMTRTLHSLSEGRHAEVEYLGRNDEIGMMANAADVFRQKNEQTEHLLLNSQDIAQSLEHRNNEMTEFVYTVSHDLKSPLVTIQGFAGVLNSAIENGNIDNAHDVVSRIQKASTRMSQTLDDLLELSRIGMVVNDFEVFDFTNCCDAVLIDLTSLINEKQAQIEVLDNDVQLYADERRVRQILQNLIQNALVHGHNPDEHPNITISAISDEREITIKVRDRGPGIDQSYHDTIFRIFQRLSNSTSGTGVGLAIVKKVAEAHGGKASVSSDGVNGTVFTIVFPRNQMLKVA
ncbi:MAG: ATP-binding protein [Phycisphaerales bacterium]